MPALQCRPIINMQEIFLSAGHEGLQGNRSIAPPILNFGRSDRQLHAPAPLSPGQQPPLPLQ